LATDGIPQSYGKTAAGERKQQLTRPGAVWKIVDVPSQNELGHFIVDDRTAQAIIPKLKSSSPKDQDQP